MKSYKMIITILVIVIAGIGTHFWNKSQKENSEKTVKIKKIDKSIETKEINKTIKIKEVNKTIETKELNKTALRIKMKKEGVILVINNKKYKKEDFPKEYIELKYREKKKFLSKYLYYKVALDLLKNEKAKYKKEIKEAIEKKKSKFKRIGLTIDNLDELILKLKTAFYTISLQEVLKENKDLTNKIENFYKQHEKEYTYPNSAEVSHISVKTENEAKDIIKKLVESNATIEDFAKLAKKYSLDIKSRNRGGYIGKISKEETSDAFFETIWKSKENSIISTPLKKENYYHIIYLFQKYDKVKKTLMQEKENIINFLLRKEIKDWRDEHFKSANEKIKVMVYDIKI